MKVYQVKEFNSLAQKKWDKRYDDYRAGEIDFAPQLIFYLMLTRNGNRRLTGYVATGWFDGENYQDKCIWRKTKTEAIKEYNK